jgi:hypothetical protein
MVEGEEFHKRICGITDVSRLIETEVTAETTIARVGFDRDQSELFSLLQRVPTYVLQLEKIRGQKLWEKNASAVGNGVPDPRTCIIRLIVEKEATWPLETIESSALWLTLSRR